MIINVSNVIRARKSYTPRRIDVAAPSKLQPGTRTAAVARVDASTPAVLESLSGEILPAGIFGRVEL